MEDDIFDNIILIFIIGLFLPIMVYFAMPFLSGSIGGFGTVIEKTAMETNGEIKPVEQPIYKSDILLMTLIADRKTPNPAKIQLNVTGPGLEIPMDNYFITHKTEMLQQFNSAIPYNGELKIDTYIGPSGIRKWVVNVK